MSDPDDLPPERWQPKLSSAEEEHALEALALRLESPADSESIRRGLQWLDQLIEIRADGATLLYCDESGRAMRDVDPLPCTPFRHPSSKHTRRWTIRAGKGDRDRLHRFRGWLREVDPDTSTRDAISSIIVLAGAIAAQLDEGLTLWAEEPDGDGYRLVML